MGCFLACFGCSKNRKRRKPANRILPGDQSFGSYEPLEPSETAKLHLTEGPVGSDSDLREKAKERPSLKIRKKVSFNLNVKSYEPIPKYENASYSLEGEEENKGEKGKMDLTNTRSLLVSTGDSIASTKCSYPSNYRYRNCGDSYDEDDEIESNESDHDDYYDEDDDDDIDYFDANGEEDDGEENVDEDKFSQTGVFEQSSASLEPPPKGTSSTQFAEENFDNMEPLHSLQNLEPKALGSNRNARDRSQYVNSVLNPVKNLTQWKAVKARAAPPSFKHQRKENIALEQERTAFISKPGNQPPCNFTPDLSQSKPLMHDIAVDASLSNWLAPSGTMSASNVSAIAVPTVPLKENILHFVKQDDRAQCFVSEDPMYIYVFN